jgi:hypothetical protein
VVLLLGTAEAMVQVLSGWLMDSWGLWCRVGAEVRCSGGVVVMAVGECGSLAGAGVVDCCRRGASGPIVDLTFALVVEAYLLCIAILPASRALRLCAISEPRPIGRLHTFS